MLPSERVFLDWVIPIKRRDGSSIFKSQTKGWGSPKSIRDKARSKILSRMPADGHPPWTFTIGLYDTWRFPELIIVGRSRATGESYFGCQPASQLEECTKRSAQIQNSLTVLKN